MKIRLLMIENNADYATVIQQQLLQEKYPLFEVQCFETLEAGLQAFKTEKKFDAALLDLSLPDSHGIDTFKQFYSEATNLPLIILIGDDNEELAQEALRKGAEDYLPKGDLYLRILARLVRHAIERHQIRKELNLVNTRLENLAFLDPLTELLNRRGLQEALSREIQWARREGGSFLVLLVGLDNFKKINDTLGHAVGDVILKEVGRKLKAVLRTTDYLARIGGDEFMILLPQTKWAEGLRAAERVRLAISQGSISSGSAGPVMVTASLGVATVTEATPSIDELLVKTHLALHRSKREGKNKVSYERKGRRESSGDNKAISDVLKALRTTDQFHVFIEPIMQLSDESKIGYELLSHLSVRGFEMPDDFFRLCLANNILTLVDHRCFQICIAAATFFPNGVRRHLNLFPSTLINVPVQHLLDSLPPDSHKGSYCIEISEQQIIGDPSYLIPAVQALKKANVLVAIDDVGFGRSCLESLILLEPDIVKIDKKCVMGFSNDVSRQGSFKRILKVADSLGTEIIAEGIESKDDLALLKELGVKYGQGFLWGKPTEIPFPKEFVKKQELISKVLKKSV
ncbi:MAG: diguanylate cyclase [Candidatus Omnitrophica bacterium]|nr:diguanylate cyclase [Candidatus Omnitrophota bacterium]